jgi:hypothetical protein
MKAKMKKAEKRGSWRKRRRNGSASGSLISEKHGENGK